MYKWAGVNISVRASACVALGLSTLFSLITATIAGSNNAVQCFTDVHSPALSSILRPIAFIYATQNICWNLSNSLNALALYALVFRIELILISRDSKIHRLVPDDPRTVSMYIFWRYFRTPQQRQIEKFEAYKSTRRLCTIAVMILRRAVGSLHGLPRLFGPSRSSSCIRTSHMSNSLSANPPSFIPIRHATHGAQGRANGPKNGPGKRLGAKKTGGMDLILFHAKLLGRPLHFQIRT